MLYALLIITFIYMIISIFTIHRLVATINELKFELKLLYSLVKHERHKDENIHL